MSGLTDRAKALIVQAQVDDALLLLVTLNHPDWAEPLRAVNSRADITSNGNLFSSRSFTLPLPLESKDDLNTTTLMLSNIDRLPGRLLRSCTRRLPGSVLLEVVFASAPDIVEIGPIDLVWTNPVISSKMVAFTIGASSSLTEGYPKDKIRPATHPGAFSNAV